MKAILLVPHPGGQYHLGENSLDDTSDMLHADTLFSALTNVYAMAFGGAERFVGMVAGGRLRFSSGFYALLTKKEPVLFLPRPPIEFPESCDPKMLKKVRYLSVAAWNALEQGFDPQKLTTGFDPLVNPSIGAEFVYLEEELPGLARFVEKSAFRNVVTAPKVKVHTTDQEDRLYHETCIQFTDIPCGEFMLKGAFYFFLEHSLHEEEWKEFLAVVRILADEGVGGQRTSGRGQFKRIEVIDVPLSTTEHAPWQVGLSPFSPADEREFHEALHFYELFVRGGGTLGHRGEAELHRRQARFVREGFLLKKHAYGRLVDVSPDSDKSMLRYGMNFPIPLGAY